MIDTFLMADDNKILANFCMACANVIGPVTGRPAMPEQTCEDGSVIPAQSAEGDPQKWYTCIRSDKELVLPDGISALTSDAGRALLGRWA